MHPVPLLHGAVLRLLLDHLAQAGAPLPLARRDGDAPVPLLLGGRGFERAALELGQPDLGLRLGGATPLERVPLGVVLRSSLTLGAALERLVRDGSRYSTGQRYWLSASGDDVCLRHAITPRLIRGRQQIGDFVLALLLKLVRRAAGPGWRPAEIQFAGAEPEHSPALAALATRRASFGHAANGFTIPRRLLALPLPRPGPIPLPLRPEDAGLPSTDPLGSLQQTVEALLRVGTPAVASAAEAAGVSVRTLQRHLRAAGMSFADLVQAIRFRAASRLLADPDVKVIEVSAALGYTDSANFTRAFRRWTGLSPQAFRRAARELPAEVSGVTPAL